ncbi:MAG: DUF58 domain-containing protein [Saprospiraceae bacterium]|nr:DUF58 domain-containing protein [Saprospiraceae bacterium]
MNRTIEQNSLRSFGNLELLARQVVEGFIIGLHKSPFHGFSVEFAEHRLYNAGESTKNIDWKVYARTDKLFTKRFEEETNLRCQIVIDASCSMFFPEVSDKSPAFINKIRFSALAGASLMNLFLKQRDAFGLTLFDENVYTHTRCKTSTAHYQLMLNYLEQMVQKPQLERPTAAAKALHQIADSIHKRSLVIVFSDMFESSESNEQLFSALQHLKHNKHEVILFHVVDKSKELDFDYDNRPYLFIDMESGERVRLQPNQVKPYYREQVAKYTEQLKYKCLQYRIDFVEADINKGFQQILQAYLVKRSRMNA